MSSRTLLLLVSLVWLFAASSQSYVLDDSVGLGRRFDGIGGLSGGGVSYNSMHGYFGAMRSM